ncbi:MAG: hypothetical protein IJE21_07030 [Alistipes sp.]|nr:hypothetical protein [Alistipes sp.]
MNTTQKEYLPPYIKLLEIECANTMLTSIGGDVVGGGSNGEMEEGGEI